MDNALVTAREERAEKDPVPSLKDLQRHCAGWECDLHVTHLGDTALYQVKCRHTERGSPP